MAGQIGLEAKPEDYLDALADIFHECLRVLKDTGTLWAVIGDTYATGSGIGSHSGIPVKNKVVLYILATANPPVEVRADGNGRIRMFGI